jgi:hypothetical protein
LTRLQRDGRPLRVKNVRNHISPRLRGKVTPIAEYSRLTAQCRRRVNIAG